MVAFDEGRYGQAIELSERTLSLNRRMVRAHLLLGDAYFKLLRHDDALRAWQSVLEINPQNRSANQRIAMLQRKRPQ